MARAARKSAVPAAAQFAMQIEETAPEDRSVAAVDRAPQAPAAPIERTVYRDDFGEATTREPFGGWLVKQQKGDNEWMAMLIGGAKADHRFPKSGDPDAVRAHLGKQGADADVLEAIDDAERVWRRG